MSRLYITREPMSLRDAVHILREAGYYVAVYGEEFMALARHGRRKRLYLSDHLSFLDFFQRLAPTVEPEQLPERLLRVVGESLGRNVDCLVTCLDMVSEEDEDFERLVGCQICGLRRSSPAEESD